MKFGQETRKKRVAKRSRTFHTISTSVFLFYLFEFNFNSFIDCNFKSNHNMNILFESCHVLS